MSSTGAALATNHTRGDPTPEMLLELLVRTMARPASGAAQRPRVVEISDSDSYDHVRPRLEAAGVACRLVDELTEFNQHRAVASWKWVPGWGAPK